MEIGERLPELVKEISQEGINRYAEATGDFNPIHVDEEFAKNTSFQGTIAHGFYIFAFLSELMMRTFGKRWTDSGQVDVRFKRPVRPGDTITLRATLVDREWKGNHSRLVFDIGWENQRQEMVISGKVSVPE
jgi:3-hydroxybutyryl-CoA dehydratase